MRNILSRISRLYQNNQYYELNRSKLGIRKSDYFKLVKYGIRDKAMTSVKFNDSFMSFNAPFWYLHSLDEIFVQEIYKFKSESPAPKILDCGANIGLSVMYFKELNKDAEIIAFEPDPTVFEQLEKNILTRNYPNVTLVNAAIWNSETSLQLYSEGSVGGKIEQHNGSMGNAVDVRTARLRNYLTTPIDFLKLDIEGVEYEVLKDCKDLLPNVKNLFIEYHVMAEEEQKLDEILSWVSAAGFRYYIKEAWDNVTHPFMKDYKDYYQMQLNIFCYRND